MVFPTLPTFTDGEVAPAAQQTTQNDALGWLKERAFSLADAVYLTGWHANAGNPIVNDAEMLSNIHSTFASSYARILTVNDDMIWLGGHVQASGGSLAAGDVLATVPAAQRPSVDTWLVDTSGSFGLLNIRASDGALRCSSDFGSSIAIPGLMQVTIPGPFILPPGPPTGLTATPGAAGEVLITWVAPVSDGGSPLTGYKIQYGDWYFPLLIPTTVDLGPTVVQFNITGLTSGQWTFATVQSVNAVGQSNNYSARVTFYPA